MDFSLFFFSGDGETDAARKYGLLLDSVKYADRCGFTAVWIPERHFHALGGLYPNPSVIAAALSQVTERIQLRAGSVILPLHDALRVAEEWSVVDNLSGGRVALAFGSGWQPNDFVFFPDRYPDRKAEMYRGIEIVKRLWAGGGVRLPNGSGEEVEVRIFPKPLSRDPPPVWVSATGDIETFRAAGRLGANVLTALLYQSLEAAAEKIEAYRRALAENGHDPRSGKVTMALHTFVGESLDAVRGTVAKPLREYLRTSIKLMGNMSHTLGLDIDVNSLAERDLEGVLSFAFERYFNDSALLGTPETCSKMVQRLRDIGVDEIACFIDFGAEEDAVMSSLVHLDALRRRWQAPEAASDGAPASTTPTPPATATVTAEVIGRAERQRMALHRLKPHKGGR
jgi:natural product biosynthesis luciferase-like monooxygenase protein